MGPHVGILTAWSFEGSLQATIDGLQFMSATALLVQKILFSPVLSDLWLVQPFCLPFLMFPEPWKEGVLLGHNHYSLHTHTCLELKKGENSHHFSLGPIWSPSLNVLHIFPEKCFSACQWKYVSLFICTKGIELYFTKIVYMYIIHVEIREHLVESIPSFQNV